MNIIAATVCGIEVHGASVDPGGVGGMGEATKCAAAGLCPTLTACQTQRNAMQDNAMPNAMSNALQRLSQTP